jgi:Uma2 family endonuclease
MAMAVQLLKRLFTVEEYHRMAEAGILSEDDRVELLEGEITAMAPIGSRHQACVDRLTELFSAQVQRRAVVRVQGPIRLGERSEPQPDLALLRRRPDFYASSHPGPEDTLLVVEVAETSAAYDREVKVPLYARFGVPEVWLVDLAGEQLEVFRQPSPQGYQDLRTLRRGEAVAPLLLPDLSLAVDALLG